MNLFRLVRIGLGGVVAVLVMVIASSSSLFLSGSLRTDLGGFSFPADGMVSMVSMIAPLVSTVAPPVFASDLWFGSADFLQWLQIPKSDARTDDKILWVVKWAVNWVLGMLAFVMLLLVLWWWFQMLTAGGDTAKYDAWLTLLKNATIGLVIVALSWMILSLIIFVITLIANNDTAPAQTDS
jgi:hypothetical protein